MSTNVNLEVLGLCLVARRKDESHHTVIAVQPAAEHAPAIPAHDVYLAFSKSALSKRDERLPSLEEAKDVDYNHIDKTMYKIKVPPQWTVVLSNPSSPLAAPGDLLQPSPSSTSDLGLGLLRAAVGRGPWQPGEAARFLLPHDQANAGWGELLGKYEFPSAKETREVADLFFWKARFNTLCRFLFQDAQNQEIGSLDLTGAAEVRIASYPAAAPKKGRAFDFCPAFSRLCTGGPAQPPIRKSPAPAHTRSGSCPPNRGIYQDLESLTHEKEVQDAKVLREI